MPERILSQKYDALKAAKESAEKKYKEDYKRWKQFKTWLFNKSKHAKALRAQLAKENLDFDVDLQELPATSGCRENSVSRERQSSSELPDGKDTQVSAFINK